MAEGGMEGHGSGNLEIAALGSVQKVCMSTSVRSNCDGSGSGARYCLKNKENGCRGRKGICRSETYSSP